MRKSMDIVKRTGVVILTSILTITSISSDAYAFNDASVYAEDVMESENDVIYTDNEDLSVDILRDDTASFDEIFPDGVSDATNLDNISSPDATVVSDDSLSVDECINESSEDIMNISEDYQNGDLDDFDDNGEVDECGRDKNINDKLITSFRIVPCAQTLNNGRRDKVNLFRIVFEEGVSETDFTATLCDVKLKKFHDYAMEKEYAGPYDIVSYIDGGTDFPSLAITHEGYIELKNANKLYPGTYTLKVSAYQGYAYELTKSAKVVVLNANNAYSVNAPTFVYKNNDKPYSFTAKTELYPDAMKPSKSAVIWKLAKDYMSINSEVDINKLSDSLSMGTGKISISKYGKVTIDTNFPAWRSEKYSFYVYAVAKDYKESNYFGASKLVSICNLSNVKVNSVLYMHSALNSNDSNELNLDNVTEIDARLLRQEYRSFEIKNENDNNYAFSSDSIVVTATGALKIIDNIIYPVRNGKATITVKIKGTKFKKKYNLKVINYSKNYDFYNIFCSEFPSVSKDYYSKADGTVTNNQYKNGYISFSVGEWVNRDGFVHSGHKVSKSVIKSIVGGKLEHTSAGSEGSLICYVRPTAEQTVVTLKNDKKLTVTNKQFGTPCIDSYEIKNKDLYTAAPGWLNQKITYKMPNDCIGFKAQMLIAPKNMLKTNKYDDLLSSFSDTSTVAQDGTLSFDFHSNRYVKPGKYNIIVELYNDENNSKYFNAVIQVKKPKKPAYKISSKIKIDDTVIKVTEGKVEADITTDFPDATRSININGTANKFALYYKLTNDLKITYTHWGQEAANNGGIAKCDRTGYIIFRTYDEAGNYIKTVAKKVTVRE